VQWGPIGIAPASNGRSTWIVDHDTAEVHVHGTITMGGFTAVGWVSVSDGPDFDLQTRGLTHTIDGVTFTAEEANLDLDLTTMEPVAADAHGAMDVGITIRNHTSTLALSDALLIVEAAGSLALDGVLEDGAPLVLPRGVHFDDAQGTVVAQGTVDGGQTQTGTLVVTLADVPLGNGNDLAGASTIDADLTVDLTTNHVRAEGRIWLSGGDINLNWSSTDSLRRVNEDYRSSSVLVDRYSAGSYAYILAEMEWHPSAERLTFDWTTYNVGGGQYNTLSSFWSFHAVDVSGTAVFGVTEHYSNGTSRFYPLKAR